MNRNKNNNAKKRNILTIKSKKEVIKFVEKNDNYQRDIVKKFQISLGTVTSILQGADAIQNITDHHLKTQSTLRITNNFVGPLLQWFPLKRSNKFPVSESNLKTMAKKLAAIFNIETFSVSNGWLSCFKRQYNLSGKSLSGESDFVDEIVIKNG